MVTAKRLPEAASGTPHDEPCQLPSISNAPAPVRRQRRYSGWELKLSAGWM